MKESNYLVDLLLIAQYYSCLKLNKIKKNYNFLIKNDFRRENYV